MYTYSHTFVGVFLVMHHIALKKNKELVFFFFPCKQWKVNILILFQTTVFQKIKCRAFVPWKEQGPELMSSDLLC